MKLSKTLFYIPTTLKLTPKLSKSSLSNKTQRMECINIPHSHKTILKLFRKQFLIPIVQQLNKTEVSTIPESRFFFNFECELI